MPPLLALFLCLVFVGYLFWLDRESHDSSSALWIPLIWMFFAGSRFFTRWMAILGIPVISGTSDVDGSPLDALLFLVLMIAAVRVLQSRRVNWRGIFFNNKWIWLYFLFGLASVVWSLYPDVSFKRVFKAAGNVLMALVILTDERPYAAFGTLLRRLAYLTLPLSVVFCKYFPALGRGYHSTGAQMFTGVGAQKNSLGQLCLLAGIFCVWSLLYRPNPAIRLEPWPGIRVEWVLLALVAWLLTMADSATSIACLAIATGILMVGRLRIARSPAALVGVTLTVALAGVVLDTTVDITTTVIEALGRRPDLTTRVPMWEDLMRRVTSPILGPGYEIFYLTPAGIKAGATWKVATAHNGYLETYLSSGVVGLFILLAGIVAALTKVARHSKDDFAGAALRLSLLVVVVLYNWTEATFRSVSNTWLVFFVAAFDPRVIRAVVTSSFAAASARAKKLSAPPVPRFAVRQSGGKSATPSPAGTGGASWYTTRRVPRY